MAELPPPRPGLTGTAVERPGFGPAALLPARSVLRRADRLTWLAIAAAALIALPILTLLASLTQPFGETMAHVATVLLPSVLVNTLLLGAIVGGGSIVIGVGTAWLVAACRFPGSRTLEWLLLLPLAMPAYIIGYAYMDLLAYAGPVQSWLRAAFGWGRGDYWFPTPSGVIGAGTMMTFVLYPYVYLLARSAFVEQSACIVDAARALGATPAESFRRIALPMAWPAIAAGVALALMETLADFGTVQYFAVETFTTVIYRAWFGMGDPVAAAQLSSGLMLFVFALIVLERRARSQRRFASATKRARVISPYRLRGGWAVLAFIACCVPVILGFGVPVWVFVRMHLDGGDPLMGNRFLSLARNSLLLAAAASALTVAVGALMAYALRVSKAPVTAFAVRFSSLGYAIPGTVVAVGVLIPFGLFDNAVDRMMRTSFGISTGLLLSGTLVAVLLAYLVRFLAVATQSLEAGYARIAPNLDDAARTLGARPVEIAAGIHTPLLRRSLLTATALVFVDVMKELPATLIVRPFNFDTLAVRVYNLASDERLVQASTGALAIVLVGLIPVILLTRAMRSSDTIRRD